MLVLKTQTNKQNEDQNKSQTDHIGHASSAPEQVHMISHTYPTEVKLSTKTNVYLLLMF